MTTRRRRARALTLLEVVLAVVMLGFVAAAIAGGTSYVFRSTVKFDQVLGGYELANRLILQHLDDKTQLPDPNLPLEYSAYRYRWKIDESRVAMRLTVENEPGRTSPQRGLGRFRYLTVRVWLVDESAGGNSAPAGEQIAELSRLYDPLAGRNPDARERNIKNPKFMQEIMAEIMNLEGPPQQRGAGEPGSGTPRSNSPAERKP